MPVSRPLHTNGHVTVEATTSRAICGYCRDNVLTDASGYTQSFVGEPSRDQLTAFEARHSHGVIEPGRNGELIGKLLVVADPVRRTVAIVCPCGERREVTRSTLELIMAEARALQAEHRCPGPDQRGRLIFHH